MGTEFRVVVYDRDEGHALSVMQRALSRIQQIDGVLSDYSAGSELRRFTEAGREAGAGTVSPDLWRTLVLAEQVSFRTGGAFDMTVGPLVRLWRRAFRQAELPDPDAIAAALRKVGWQGVAMDRSAHSAWPTTAGMGLDAGGIGKGYALDQAMELIQEEGITSALVEGGGDLVVSAAPPGRRGWRIRLAWSEGLATGPTLLLAHDAVATSGDLYQFLELDGMVYSHILDPRTGWALTGSRRATVVGPSGAIADGLASALCVDGPAGIVNFIESWPGVEAIVLERDPANGETVSCGSEGWAAMMEMAVGTGSR